MSTYALSKRKTIQIENNSDGVKILLADNKSSIELGFEDYCKFKREFELLEAIFETEDVVTAIQRVHQFGNFTLTIEQPHRKAKVTLAANGSKFTFYKNSFLTLLKQSKVIEETITSLQ